MSDITSNRTSEYLKAHAEMETEDPLMAPGSPRRLFKLHWDEAVTNLVANGGREPSANSKAIAEMFFLWGWYDGRLTPCHGICERCEEAKGTEMYLDRLLCAKCYDDSTIGPGP